MTGACQVQVSEIVLRAVVGLGASHPLWLLWLFGDNLLSWECMDVWYEVHMYV